MSYFSDRVEEGMRDPEFRAGWEEAERELRGLRARRRIRNAARAAVILILIAIVVAGVALEVRLATMGP